MKYDYGGSVEVMGSAPECYSPGVKGSLCGARRIETEEQAKVVNVSIGTVLWIVEFANGSSSEVPEEYLVPLGQEREEKTNGDESPPNSDS